MAHLVAHGAERESERAGSARGEHARAATPQPAIALAPKVHARAPWHPGAATHLPATE